MKFLSKVKLKLFIIFCFCTLIFIFIPKKHIFACTRDSDCFPACFGNCYGWCKGYTQVQDCLPIICSDCKQCITETGEYECKTYGYACICGEECTYRTITGGRCFYEDICVNRYCHVPGGLCQIWSGWSVCYSTGWQYRTCIVGTNVIDWRTCGSSTPASSQPPPASFSCILQLTPSTTSVNEGGSTSFIANVSDIFGTVEEVRFSSGNTLIASVNPSSDSEVSYLTNALGLSQGSTSITANAIMNSVSRCSDSSTITVTPPSPWWQVKNSDIATTGSLTSYIPLNCQLPNCTPFFDIDADGDGGYPGIPFYEKTYFFGTNGDISSTNWIAKTSISITKYTYSFFEKLIPSNVTINEIIENSVPGEYFLNNGTETEGYYWFKYQGNIADFYITSDLNLGNRKVVLLLDGKNLHIAGKINLTDGFGFFMTIAGKDTNGDYGNIYIEPSVTGSIDSIPEIEGIFLAENAFYTGSTNSQLHIRGSIVGYDGIYLQRDLEANNSLYSSELIEYAPDLIMLFPSELKYSKINWKEIAP